jgi:hypothetical protein
LTSRPTGEKYATENPATTDVEGVLEAPFLPSAIASSPTARPALPLRQIETATRTPAGTVRTRGNPNASLAAALIGSNTTTNNPHQR